jgi:hypothetical protein
MAQAAEQIAFEIIDPSTHNVSSVDFPQLADKITWMLERLRDRFPGYQDTHIINWLRSVSGSNGISNYRFVCTKHAAALSEYRIEQMTVKPIVIDHFVLIEEGADVSEGEALYDDMKRWALSIGATEIKINPKSDVPVEQIEDRVGKIVERKVLFAKVGK